MSHACRLRDEAQVQAAQAAAAEQEAVTLRHQLATKDAALAKAAEEKALLTNRMLGAEGTSPPQNLAFEMQRTWQLLSFVDMQDA